MSVRIRHREYIQDVLSVSGSVPSVTSFLLTPTNPVTFPWLADIADNWEQWRLHGAVYEYVPLSGQLASTVALGYVTLCTEYDVNKPLVVSRAQAENMEYTTTTVPYNGMLHPIECKRAETTLQVLYIATNNVLPANGEPNFYQFANTMMLVGGQSANGTVLGSIFLNYEVELIKPRLQVSLAPSNSVNFQSTASVSSAAVFGTSAMTIKEITGEFSYGQTFSAINNTISWTGMPYGSTLNIQYVGTGASVTVGDMTAGITYTGCNAGAYLYDNGNYTIRQAPASGVASAVLIVTMQVVQSAYSGTGSITWPGSANVPTTGNGLTVIINGCSLV